MLINKYAKLYKKHKKIFIFFSTLKNKKQVRPVNTRIMTKTIVINNTTKSSLFIKIEWTLE